MGWERCFLSHHEEGLCCLRMHVFVHHLGHCISVLKSFLCPIAGCWGRLPVVESRLEDDLDGQRTIQRAHD